MLGVSEFLCNFTQFKKYMIMAIAIKAIPTLYGEEAVRFKKHADEAERNYKARPRTDWSKSPGVIEARKMWAEMER